MATEEFKGSRAFRGKRKEFSPEDQRILDELHCQAAKDPGSVKDAYRSP